YSLTAAPEPVSVVSIAPVSPNPRNAAVTSIDVTLSAAIPTSSLSGALKLTLNGQTVPLNNISVTQNGTKYTIGNLAPLQTAAGNYVLSVNGAQLTSAGVGFRSVSWVVNKVGPVVHFYSDAPSSTAVSPIPITAQFSAPVSNFSAASLTVTNGTVTNFIGAGSLYFFDAVPAAAGLVTVNLAANAVQDAAGNGNPD